MDESNNKRKLSMKAIQTISIAIALIFFVISLSFQMKRLQTRISSNPLKVSGYENGLSGQIDEQKDELMKNIDLIKETYNGLKENVKTEKDDWQGIIEGIEQGLEDKEAEPSKNIIDTTTESDEDQIDEEDNIQ